MVNEKGKKEKDLQTDEKSAKNEDRRTQETEKNGT